MISRFVGSSPVLGSGLTAQSLGPASDSVSPSFSVPSPLAFCLSLFFKCLFILGGGMSRGGAEREGGTESEAGSRLQAVSTEPDAGLEPTNREIMT